ncbi:hypothetical protein [Paenibacillus sp. ISL-20]|nr:hypothetical protein [Paenibacillus sp. ISL-20]
MRTRQAAAVNATMAPFESCKLHKKGGTFFGATEKVRLAVCA